MSAENKPKSKYEEFLLMGNLKNPLNALEFKIMVYVDRNTREIIYIEDFSRAGCHAKLTFSDNDKKITVADIGIITDEVRSEINNFISPKS